MIIDKIRKLEKILSDVEESPEMLEKLTKDSKVKTYLEDAFSDSKKVSFSKIVNISQNELINDLVYNYAQNNLTIIDDNENLDMKETSLMSMYLKDISYYPLLTKEEEKKLATKIKYGTKEEKKKAQDELVNHNLRLVISIARRYVGKKIPLIDLIQEGNQGLMKATEKYDVDMGYSFSTYVTWWIKQSISRYIADSSRTIRVPVHEFEFINKMKKVEEEYTNRFGKIPNTEELANFIVKEKFEEFKDDKIENKIKNNKSKNTIKRIKYNYCLNLVKRKKDTDLKVISLNKEAHPNNEKEEGSELEDFISDRKPSNNPITSSEYNNMKEIVQETLNNPIFSPEDREFIRLRFGIQNEKCMTDEEICEILISKAKKRTKKKILKDIAKTEKIIKDNPEEAKYLSEGIIIKSSLTLYQRELMELKYAIPSSGYKTLEEIGEIFGIRKESARMMEVKALKKLRHPIISKKLKYLIKDK
ncbi:MAG: sigma-70 family RNA polymerase sigma factor [Bacilli bacterium]|nr:sigma-70 family RNA polymerase sigma factor [Bacilli bacterium]